MDQSRREADPTGWQEPPQPGAAPIHFGLPRHEDPGPTMNGAGPDPNARVDEDDLDLLAEVNRRPSRTTALLLIGILAALTFIGGVVVQKQYGGTAASGAPAAAGGGFGARAGGNANFAGGGGFPGGAGGAPGGAAGGSAGGAATGRTTTATAPVVVGTVTKMSGNSLTVKNLGGKSVKVNVKEGATITLVAGKTLTTLKSGATVSVVGTTGTDGTVAATAITVRS